MKVTIVDPKKYIALGKKLIDHVKDLFPPDTQYVPEFKDSQFTCSIHWPLNNDKDRPDKFSRGISIRIFYLVLDDCNYKERKDIVNNKFRIYIKERLDSFNPEHSSSKYEPLPFEIWEITNKILN